MTVTVVVQRKASRRTQSYCLKHDEHLTRQQTNPVSERKRGRVGVKVEDGVNILHRGATEMTY